MDACRPWAYAATCIFILVLGVVHRLLIAFRNIAFEQTFATNGPARGEKVGPSPPTAEEDEMSACLGGNGAGEKPQPSLVSASPWRRRQQRLPTNTTRAFCELAIALASYLLMLAAMTMNIGYFLSALGGIFFGTLLAGRFGTDDDNSCH